MKKILIFSPHPTDACSFYRGIGAFAPLHREGYIIEPAPESINWSTIMGADLFFMQRPFHEKHLKIAEIVQRQMPLWIDYDDALFNVPPDNPAYNTYAQPKTHDTIAEIIGRADFVTVTTKSLLDSLEERKAVGNSAIIPNAHNDYLFPLKPPEHSPNSIVFWRGSDSHQGDLTYFSEQYHSVMKSFPSHQYLFMGMVPWMLPDGATFSYNRGVDIFDYFPVLRKTIRPAVQVVPLIDSPFNRAKSNIAWLEATYAGGVSVVPEWTEWDRPGAFTYTDKKGFEDAFSAALHMSLEDRASLHRLSWKDMQENYLLSQINVKRKAIIEELT